ncbi:MAG TPA: hypothetical protein VGL63_06955 [Streptosporangiaceae bacterium]|jgi:hypothetical protein
MDQAGILVNAGFQCCDAWELQSSKLTTAADYAVMQNSALTLGESLRNDPSVFSFQWSDEPPLAMQETVTLNAFAQADFLLRADVRRGTPGGQEQSGDNELQTSTWNGDDITLWNAAKIDIAAPVP